MIQLFLVLSFQNISFYFPPHIFVLFIPKQISVPNKTISRAQRSSGYTLFPCGHNTSRENLQLQLFAFSLATVLNSLVPSFLLPIVGVGKFVL